MIIVYELGKTKFTVGQIMQVQVDKLAYKRIQFYIHKKKYELSFYKNRVRLYTFEYYRPVKLADKVAVRSYDPIIVASKTNKGIVATKKFIAQVLCENEIIKETTFDFDAKTDHSGEIIDICWKLTNFDGENYDLQNTLNGAVLPKVAVSLISKVACGCLEVSNIISTRHKLMRGKNAIQFLS